MATKGSTLDLDIAFFNELYPLAYPNACEITEKQARQMVKDGVIQIEALFELSVSKIGKLKRQSIEGMDFDDKSDAKKTSVRTCRYGSAYAAPISQVHTKKGSLRVMCYERKNDKFYYFVIPKFAFKHITATSNIEIPFELDGTPRRIPRRAVNTNWWKYEVDSFKEMASVKRPNALTISELRRRQEEHAA